MEKLYQVSSWGPDDQDDVVYLVQAGSFTEAAALVDTDLTASSFRDRCSGFANSVIELGQTLAAERGATIVNGPFLTLSGARGGFRDWTREDRLDRWYDWSSQTYLD